MSIKTMSRVWEHSRQSGSQLLMLLALADYADDDGVSWSRGLKMAHYAKKARLSERQAQRLFRDLEDAGELHCVTGTGRGHATKYLITIGLAAEQIAEVLIREFDLTPIEAALIIEKVSHVSPIPEERVTSRVKKGDIQGQKERHMRHPFGADPGQQDAPDPGAVRHVRHDPSMEEESRAREQKRSIAKNAPRHVSYLSAKGMWAAPSFAALDPDACIADFDARIAAGQTIESIVTTWQSIPPIPGATYERQLSGPGQSGDGPNRPGRSNGREDRQREAGRSGRAPRPGDPAYYQRYRDAAGDDSPADDE